MGQMVAFPRRTRAYGQDYRYTGQTQVALPLDAVPSPVPDVLHQLRAVPGLGEHDAVLLNWYDAGLGEYMGAHADDESALTAAMPIVSLSWCSGDHYRRFRFTPQRGCQDALLPTWDPADKPGIVRLHNGCLLVMGGLCQRTHKHELMKPRKAAGENAGRRINLTLRAFARLKRSREAD